MTSAEHEHFARAAKLAGTYARKAADLVAWFAGRETHPDVLAWLGWEAGELLGRWLSEADTLARHAHPDQLDDLEHDVKKLAAEIRRRRLTLALSDTTGRTPAEAAAFAAKAEQLQPTTGRQA